MRLFFNHLYKIKLNPLAHLQKHCKTHEYVQQQQKMVYSLHLHNYPAQTGVAKEYWGDTLIPYRAYWALKTAQEDVATWSPSGSDSLAEDWLIVN